MGAGEDPPLDRLRAAMRLVSNHEAVVRFAARGCGSPGRRPVSAPLSDPTAKPGEVYLPDVDAGVIAILTGALDLHVSTCAPCPEMITPVELDLKHGTGSTTNAPQDRQWTGVSRMSLANTVAGLRHVAHALLAGADAKQHSASGAVAVGEGESMNGDAVVASAMYVRDRVGVPRDLPLPAARQLRAHLNWMIATLV